MDGKQPITGYLFRFSPNPCEGAFYELPFSFACVNPLSQHVPASSLSHLNTKTRVGILFSNCGTETKALFLQTSQKETGNINPLNGRFFQISFPQTDCLQELFSSFLSFPVNTSFFYNIFIWFVFLSSCRRHNILLPDKVGKIPIICKQWKLAIDTKKEPRGII